MKFITLVKGNRYIVGNTLFLKGQELGITDAKIIKSCSAARDGNDTKRFEISAKSTVKVAAVTDGDANTDSSVDASSEDVTTSKVDKKKDSKNTSVTV